VQITNLELEFKQHKKYSESIRRLRKRRLPFHGGKPGQLPPLDEKEIKMVA